GHDGNKLRRRLGMWIRDEQRMFNEVIPLSAQRLGLTDVGWIEEASRHNFLRYLSSASREFAPSERAEIAPLFQTWALRVAGEAQLRVFAEGGTVEQPITLPQRVKRIVRPYAQRLNALVRGE